MIIVDDTVSKFLKSDCVQSSHEVLVYYSILYLHR